MIQTVSMLPEQLLTYTELNFSAKGSPLDGFPLLSIDRDSYIVQAEIQSGINFRLEHGCHCIAIGKGCSVADGVTFMIALNHDYKSVFQGSPRFLQGTKCPDKIVRKGTVILQNDVWIGHGATIMAGVTLHNGCIVAAESVVTKDVPPYAIVGGNPAKILRYRFGTDIVEALQKIAWWDWPEKLQEDRKEDFVLPADEFIEKYAPFTDTYQDMTAWRENSEKSVIFFPIDIGDPFPLYPKILKAFFEKDRPSTELLIYFTEEQTTPENIRTIENILQKYEHRDSYVTLQSGVTLDEQILFQGADYYITTRSRGTVYRTCLADRWDVKVLYGTDNDLFPPEVE